MDTNPITGKEYLNRLETEGLDTNLLNTLVTGKRTGFDEQGNPSEVTLDVILDEKDAANIILALKDIIIKQGDDFKPQLTLNKINPIVKKEIQKYDFNPTQIRQIVREVTETYGPQPIKVTENLKNPNIQVEAREYLSEKQVATLVKELSSDIGGGRQTKEILSDELNNAIAISKDNPLDVKNNFITKTQDIASRYLSTSIGGFIREKDLVGGT